MAGADTVLRLLGGTLALVVVAFVAAVGYMLLDPLYTRVIDPAALTALGWGAPQDVVMLFAGVAFVGLAVVAIAWWLVAEVRQDVRPEQRPPF